MPRTAAPKTAAPKKYSIHTAKKIAEMLIVLVVVLLLICVGIFLTQIYGVLKPRVVVNNYYSYNPTASETAAEQAFQQVTAPAGQAVPGFPKALIPAHGTITSSYHNQYNGFDQYTLVVAAKADMPGEYTAFQQLLASAKFKITQKSATSTEDTIDAQQGSDYATVQLVSNSAQSTTITINYGSPIK